MTRRGELLEAWASVGMQQIEQSNITIRTEYGNFADYWLPIKSVRVAWKIGNVLAVDRPRQVNGRRAQGLSWWQPRMDEMLVCCQYVGSARESSGRAPNEGTAWPVNYRGTCRKP